MEVLLLLILMISSSNSAGPIKPMHLKQGDTVGLVSPASPYVYDIVDPNQYLEDLISVLNGQFGLQVLFGKHMNETFGYLAGDDEDRAADVNAFFADPTVKYILANRGGFGCGRMIDLIDYKTASQNPKIIMGYSDLTALLHAIYFKTGMVTYYGPMGIDNWNNLNSVYVQKVLFNGEMVTYKNPSNYNITTINSGTAKGRLLGGNLSVFVSLLGSEYIPSTTKWEEVILLMEDVGEEPYRIDRMITTLKLNKILSRVAGFVWGICVKCDASDPTRSLTLQQVLDQHLKPTGVPSFSGLMFGHISQQFTFPLGIMASMDANKGTIQLLESPVS